MARSKRKQYADGRPAGREAKAKSGQLHLPGTCACGNPADLIKHNEFVCKRCDDIENRTVNSRKFKYEGTKKLKGYTPLTDLPDAFERPIWKSRSLINS